MTKQPEITDFYIRNAYTKMTVFPVGGGCISMYMITIISLLSVVVDFAC